MKRFKAVQACLAFMMLILSVFLIIGCGSDDETGHWLPPGSEKQLVSINVTPSTVSVPIGATRQFTATAAYDDGTSADVTASSVWASGSTGVATVNSASGLATGVTAGTAIITAAFDGKSDTATLTVLSNTVTLSSIVVTPATPSILIGLTQPFVATGHYSDGSSADISTVVAWTSGTPGVATVNSTSGLATGVAEGTSIITASLSGKSGSATLTVLPPSVTISSVVVTPATASIPKGLTQTFVAKIIYSDGRSLDVSNNALTVWTSSNPGVATVVSPGIATGVAKGTTTITATVNCGTCESIKSGSATLTVTDARLMSINVTPETASVAVGVNQPFVATGTYSDGTSVDISTSVAWSTAPTGIATVVSNTGVATGVAVGSTHIIATSGSVSDYGVLTVTLTTPPGTCASGALPLGSAASFAVLGGPALNITNPNTVTGDVGALSISVPTGPQTLYGNLYDSTGTGPTVIGNAETDMQTAINCALARPCDHNYVGVTDFSALAAVTPLQPGVYCVAGAMNVSSPVILNLTFPGVYIFRSTGALTTPAGVTVQLSGSATSANTSIFWVSAGAASGASIGANNVFLGTILVSPGAITLGANTTLLGGRVLSFSAVTINNNFISIP